MDKNVFIDSSSSAEKLFSKIPIATLFILIELLFAFPTSDLVLGPVLAVLLCYFYFVKQQRILVTVILIFGNDALGTLMFGNISTVYLVFVLLIFELAITKKISIRLLCLSAFVAFYALLPAINGVITFKIGILTVAYVLLLLLQYQKCSDGKFVDEFQFAIAFITTLQALHLVLFGGVHAVEGVDRAGLVGIGIGDANYSALTICAGMASVMNNSRLNRFTKIVMSTILISAMILTQSITGLIAMLLCVFFSLSFDKKMFKTAFRLILVLIILIGIFLAYQSLPAEYHIGQVDSYLERVEEKIGFAQSGNYDEATTHRSELVGLRLQYIEEEMSLVRQLFGFNSLKVGGDFMSHNTYVDFLLQVGFLGSIVAWVYVLNRVLKNLLNMKMNMSRHKYILIMKTVFLFFSAALSLYQGPLFTTFFIFCFWL